MRVLSGCLLCLLSFAACAQEPYAVDYVVNFDPARKDAKVSITLQTERAKVGELRFSMDPKRYTEIGGDGEILRKGDSVTWHPPRAGGTLHYRYAINHKHGKGGYDAQITSSFAIVRGDDLVPPVVVRASRGAHSRAHIRAVMPKGWGSFETPWRPVEGGERSFEIVDPARRFDRPTGWIIAGDLGVRRDVAAGISISVAAPKGESMRRNDVLAFVHALAPELEQAFDKLPEKVLIVAAGDPMWRGGLSGPRSLFLHADRPLISENGTSTLVHELTHVITRLHAVPGDDWIVEGIAEFYSMTLLNRAGLLSDARLRRGMAWMHNHGRAVKRLHTSRSSGATTARAVVLLAALDKEIRLRTHGNRSLDDVTRALTKRRQVSLQELRDIAAKEIGAPAKALDTPLLD